MPQVSVAQLVDDNRGKLKLSWLAGRAGAGSVLDSKLINASSRGLIGHLNFIHANWIQVVAAAEVAYLATLDPTAQTHSMDDLAENRPVCFIMAGGEAPPPALLKMAEASDIPLLSAPLQSVQLMWLLRHYLARGLAEAVTRHGVFLDVLGMGVLITGDSGVGKSELGLELISRGNSGLVADDIVEFYRIAPETLEGRCPELLRDFLEVRGLGMLNIRTIFGETAVRPRRNLKLIVHLKKPQRTTDADIDRLPLGASSEEIAGVEVRKVVLPVAVGRNLAVLVEAAVRNYVLQLRGIDSTQNFVARHEQYLSEDSASST
ncbi:MAG: HPr kinase/phosphorylase [Burkholderiales bacterium]|nr:HPr kinase/phosphorylase [Burkholderiales bacterium]